MTITRALMVSLLAALAASAGADVWDTQGDNDNSDGTDNELIHGSNQVHDLGALSGPTAADQDWYLLSQKPRSSYEIVIDETSGDIGSGKGPQVERVAVVGTTVQVLQTSVPVDEQLAFSRTMRFQNVLATAVSDQFIRVLSGNCTTECGPDDRYRIRAYETTYAIPRFNNSATQGTVVLIQNPTDYVVNGTLVFFNGAGTVLHQQPFTINPHALFSLSAGTIGALAGQSGSITVVNDARYGDLVGKSVALEPSTGFAFDTPMTWRPR
jgi:hypothetical protein